MILKKILILLLIIYITIFNIQCINTIKDEKITDPIKIDTGLISGILLNEKENIRIYRGIPYAFPPIGENRWKPPKDPKPWDGVKECIKFGPVCPQPKSSLSTFERSNKFSEDCLYLNVWTPAKSTNDKLPVMVWIHGGIYSIGSGSMSIYDGENLCKKGVVVVTINYRLGPFGFFAHESLSEESEQKVSGNYGILDQIFALKWIKKNINAFGGNPENITIFGESAGAGSVTCLLVSPLSKGLFHKAIAQSGSYYLKCRDLKKHTNNLEPMEKVGEKITKMLNCDKSLDVLNCLRSVTAEKLLNTTNPELELFGNGIKFEPVIDGYVIPDIPSVLFEKGLYNKVPFLTGTNADEGTILAPDLDDISINGYEAFIKLTFGEKYEEDIFNFFPAKTDKDVPNALNKLITVSAFVTPAREIIREISKSEDNCFLYHFVRVPLFSKKANLGSFHGLEIPYVFQNLGEPFTEKDKEISRIMSKYWVNFARSGDPNSNELFLWEKYNETGDKNIEIGEVIKINANLYKNECDLFAKIYNEW